VGINPPKPPKTVPSRLCSRIAYSPPKAKPKCKIKIQAERSFSHNYRRQQNHTRTNNRGYSYNRNNKNNNQPNFQKANSTINPRRISAVRKKHTG
jgi:hypothetical protein